MTWTHRLRSALHMLTKGTSWPFDQVPNSGGSPDRVRKPYAQSVWVQRAIKKVAQPISAISLQFSAQSGGSEQLLANPALAQYWADPAKNLSRSDWVEASVGWLKLVGEFFWILDDSHLVPFPEMAGPSPLLVARPDRMKHVLDEYGQLAGWEFTDGKNRKHNLLPEQVVFQKYWNPYDDHRGLGELEAALIAVESDFLAGKFARNLLANGGDRGPYVVAKNGIVNDDQRRQIIEQLRQKRAQAQAGDFAPVFLTGDISVEDPQVQLPDQSFIQLRLRNRHEIFIAFGVPASMADIVASYSVGSASDRFLLIEETCQPTAEKLAEGVQTATEVLFGERVFSWFNWDEHSVMRQVRAERLDTMIKLTGQGMPVKEANEYLQLGLPEFPGWDVGLVPFSLQRLDQVTDAAQDDVDPFNLPPEGGGEEGGQSASKMLAAHFAARATTTTRGRDLATWKKHMARRRPHLKNFASKFNRALLPARNATLRKVSLLVPSATAQAGAAAPVTRAASADLVFDLGEFQAGLVLLMRNAAKDALVASLTEQSADLGKSDDPWSMPSEEVAQYLKARENHLKGVATGVWETIKGQLQESLAAGETQEKMIARVKRSFAELGQVRAKRIAVTETSAAYGAGNARVMKAAGVQWKKWVASGFPNMRDEHHEADQQVVRVTEKFTVGGEGLDHPGDPAGSAWNVINCNCISIAVEGPDGATV